MKMKYCFIAFIAAAYHLFRRDTVAANTYDAAVETHETTITRTNDAAVTARHLLWKKGAADGSVAVCGENDVPLGTIDNVEAGTGIRQTVLLLGKGPTKKMVADGGIAAGALVYAAASGKVDAIGTQIVGVALTAAANNNDILEVADFPPTSATPGIPAATFDAHSILAAEVDNTPAVLAVAAQRIIGRITGGTVAALTGDQVRGITDPITWTSTNSSGTGAGLAIPITHRSVNRTVAGTEALTLANGAFLGQRLSIICVAQSGGTGTLTPTTASGWTSIAFAEKGQGCELEWTTAGWRLLGFHFVTNKPLIVVP
jgi:hypothetical protein